MALQWMILAYVVAAEAAVAILLTLPSPKALKHRIVSTVSLILQPTLFIIPFAGFQLLDIYWKNEHRLKCYGETCTAAERDRYEKAVYLVIGETACNSISRLVSAFGFNPCSTTIMLRTYKSQRNAVLCVGACLLYWCIYRVCKYHRDIQAMEEAEKRYKDE